MKAYWFDNLEVYLRAFHVGRDRANTSQGDQREDHNSGNAVDAKYLSDIGVLYYHCPSMTDVDFIASTRSYKNRDEITVSPEKMGSVYEEKVKMYFHEHLHEDEEIRYILDGEGFFDVRSADDDWVRIRLEKFDLLILPAEPKWTALNRAPELENNEHRKEYIQSRGFQSPCD
ncbi:MAG: hypothetical protein Q9195_001414 [Heterodermia aff. obscurata]